MILNKVFCKKCKPKIYKEAKVCENIKEISLQTNREDKMKNSWKLFYKTNKIENITSILLWKNKNS